ncbi:MAG: helix-turn-helix transcriptional regulator [Treponema sp.]|nr:helix-turn-helix transcriptional regulator [Treponema sp.]
MDLRTVFITNLKRCRKEQKISQMRLAELCGTSTSYIGEIEIAKKFPSIEMIEKIARALSIRPFQLFQDENDNTAGSRQRKRALVEKIQKSVEDIIMGGEEMPD